MEPTRELIDPTRVGIERLCDETRVAMTAERTAAENCILRLLVKNSLT